MGGDRPDPVLILCKAAGFGWPTVKALIVVRPNGKGTSGQGLDVAYGNFERLSRPRPRSVSFASGRSDRTSNTRPR